MSFGNFWRRNLGCARLAVISQFEYRFNLFIDAVLQPVVTAAIEVALWAAIFNSVTRADGLATFAGFSRDSYLAYALWAAFFARISSSWMYEYRMIEEIETGTVNSVLARPISFYEYYLSQFMGYKILTSLLSLVVPVVIVLFIPGPTQLARLPLAFLLVIFYLVLVHTISFLICSFGFFFNRIHSFTVAKNFLFWFMTGELFPLDLVPQPFRGWLAHVPFSSAVYVPVGYLTGRLELTDMLRGFVTVAAGIVVTGILARFFWLKGRQVYAGTGA